MPPRSAGVVLHVSSLPGPHGSGDFGPEAHRFVDWLAASGQHLWQVLPLTPVGYGYSPYQGPSAFAGNPMFVAFEPLVERGWLKAGSLADARFAGSNVEFDRVVPWRQKRLREAFAGFEAHAPARDLDAFATWCEGEGWLAEYTLFMALKMAHEERAWWTWQAALARRTPQALADARIAHADEMRFWAFTQWCFDEQLAALRKHARARGVKLVGDVPIFVAHDSADCWARPELFQMDAEHRLTAVSGVPPDAYTADGQRWGNPLYRWDRMAEDGYEWWTARLARTLAQCDLMRIDHFRGFAGCWEIPAECPTARDGRWVAGPGAALFEAAEAALGRRLPIVAEDLGTITPDVTALLERLGFPGMRIVFEAFIYGPQHPFMPHHHVPHALAYTSTHDSPTVRGWWRSSTPEQRALAAAYLGLDADDADAPVHRAVHRATLASVARWALAPMQDLLGSTERMNRPGTASGNWSWRFAWRDVPEGLAAELLAMARAAARCEG